MLHMTTEEFIKEKRLIQVYLFAALLIQIVILLAYYFKEKQMILSFPMILGIVMTFGAFLKVRKLGSK